MPCGAVGRSESTTGLEGFVVVFLHLGVAAIVEPLLVESPSYLLKDPAVKKLIVRSY